MRPSDLTAVRNLDLFSGMEEINFTALMAAAYLQTFPARVDLIKEGDPADFLHIVVDGRVELYAKSNNRETTLGHVKPVSTFVLAAVLSDAIYLMSARTSQKSKVLMIPSINVRQVFEQDETFARALVLELSGCYRNIVKEHKDLKLRTAVERLANRLLRYNQVQGGTGRIQLEYDKRTLASLLGMTPENLSRAFNTLKNYGVLVKGSRIELTDQVALVNFSKPNRLIDDDFV